MSFVVVDFSGCLPLLLLLTAAAAASIAFNAAVSWAGWVADKGRQLRWHGLCRRHRN